MMKRRDVRFDILKAMAILMVVTCHIIDVEGLSDFRGGKVAAFISGVNMPLFFVISGYFGVDATSSWRKTLRRYGKFLKNMMFYSLLLAVVLYGLGAYDTICLAAKRVVTIPIIGWWFMWSLIFSMIVACVGSWFRRMLPPETWITVSGFAILYLALLILPDTWWQVKYFKFCFPFYAFGIWVRKRIRLSEIRPSVIGAIWIVSVAFYGLYAVFYRSFPVAFYWGDFNLCSIFSGLTKFGSHLLRYAVAAFGIIALSVPIYTLKENRLTLALAELGTTTLGVYFLHQSILKYVVVPVCLSKTPWSLCGLFALSILLWLICHAIVFYFSRHSLTRRLFC